MKKLVLIILISTCQLSAQFTLYTPENSELPSTNITDMVVDYGNRLWIATDTGLVVFENDIWTTFNTNNSNLRTNYIQDLYLDNSGNLYVLNQNAVFIYNNNTFEVFLDNISATTFAVDNQQRLLTNTNHSLVRFESNKVDTLLGKLFNRQQIGDIKVDKFNTIYFRRDFEGGIDIINKEDELLKFDFVHSLSKIFDIEDIAIDSNNNLWLSNYKKLYFYNTLDSTSELFDNEDSDVFERTIIFRKIAVNSDNIPFSVGSFIVPQRAFLIFIYNDKVYTYPILDYFDSEDFQMDMNAMAIDLNNYVWIHINNIGLLKFDPSLASVEQIPTTDYTIYPNPATSQISVDLGEGLLVAQYRILDAEGREVLSGQGDLNSIQVINLQPLSVGAYSIELTTATGELVRDKFVKR